MKDNLVSERKPQIHADTLLSNNIIDNSLPSTVVDASVGPEKPWPEIISFLPQYLKIPKIGLSEVIHLPAIGPVLDKDGNPVLDDKGKPLTEFKTPNRGLAIDVTDPNNPPSVPWLYGHSEFDKLPGTFSRLIELEKGDSLFISGVSPKKTILAPGWPLVEIKKVPEELSDLEYKKIGKTFIVDEASLEEGDIAKYLSGGVCPRVILLTSLKVDGVNSKTPNSWIFNPDFLSDAVVFVKGDVYNTEKYLWVAVVAEMDPEEASKLSNGFYRCQ